VETAQYARWAGIPLAFKGRQQNMLATRPSVAVNGSKFVVAFAICAATSITSAFAAVNAYLTLDGIDGPSTSKPHAIDVLSFSVGVGSTDPSKLQKAVCSNLSVMKVLDQTSPLLFQAAVTGRPFATAVLAYDRPVGAEQQTYFTLTLENALLTSVQESGSNENPTESVSLKSSTMTFSYRPQKPDGSLLIQ
jgi:type VI secretion system secreted protein Hcp